MRYIKTYESFENIINSFKKLFHKGEEKKETPVNFDVNTLEDCLTPVKDCGFDIKMINFSLTSSNGSLLIIIKPNTPNYNIDEFFSELENSISHIKYNDMSVEMNFSIDWNNLNRYDFHEIHSYLIDIYPNIFGLRAHHRDALPDYLSKVDNFKKFVNNPDMTGHLDKLKLSIVIKLDITVEV